MAHRLTRSILLLLFGAFLGAPAISAQTRTVTGKVTELGGEVAIVSALINLEGTTTHTYSNDEGNFSLELPAGEQRLTVQIIGYRSTEVSVGADETTITIELARDVLNLDEIVVTGQATGVRRQNLANAVATISSDDLTRAPLASFEQALQGRLAGANVQANNGAPGGGIQVQLRGTSSIIGDHRPLYVVDGVIVSNDEIASNVHVVTVSSSNPVRGGQQDNAPNRIADLNPNDIESIEVLKGASASAIYGSKATNGVVLITTKRGRVGAPRFNFTQRLGFFQKANDLGLRKFDTVDDAVEAFGPNAANFYSAGAFFDHEEYLAGNTPLSYESALSVNGGNESTRYYVSGLVKHDGGIVTGTGYDKQSLKLNVDQSIGSSVLFRISTTALHTKTARGFTNNDNRSISYWMTLPSTPSFIDLRQREDGSWPHNPFANSNILETAANVVNDEDVYRFIGAGNLSWDALVSGGHSLRFVANAGVDFFTQQNTIFSPPELQYEPDDGLPGTSVKGDAASRFVNVSTNAIHTYTHDRFRSTFSAGIQYEERDLDISRIAARNLVAGLSNADDGTDLAVRQQRQQVRDFGFFVQEEFLLGDRLLLTGAIRADQSSNNAEPSSLFYYPKAAASYRFPGLFPGIVDELKLRAAFGQSGNQPLYGQKFSTLNTGNIGGLQTFSVSGTTVAPDLKPERQREIEVGTDATILGDRATVEFTVYQKRITDLLLQRALPPSTGFGTQIFNGGVLETLGVEAGLTLFPVTTESFSWSTIATYSMDRSEIVELPVPEFRAGGFGTALGGFQITEGESPSAFFGRDTAAVANDPRCGGPCEVGDRIIVVLGDANPDFRMGFGNDVRFGDFSAYMLWDWQQGGTVANLTGWLYDLSKNAEDYADACTDPGCMPGETLGDFRLRVYPSKISSIWLEDATFLKLREVTFNYVLPERFTGMLWDRVSTVTLSLSGRNVLTFTGYGGMDPEVSNFGSEAIARNIDVAPYPPSRSFWFSVNMGF
ncbi:MAG: SusC/RagA family TonB-linked outer membrane protein [Gemmatimonadetes bacterium]|nr:SusC/RagA family TonB-linked outer membrane protein [Gemmatimonadota bacterium]